MRLDGHVTFTGFLDEPAKRQAYTDCDLVVIPSRSEVFALTAVESLLCGTPVLLSSACGLYPLPAAGVCRFESENVENLSSQLQTMFCYKRTCPVVDGRDFIAKHFSLTAVAAKAEAAYSEVLAK